MPSPATWLALEAIKTALQAITTAGGYHTDLGADVRAELYQEDISAAPVCLLGVEQITPSAPATRVQVTEIALVVEAIVDATDATAQLKAHECIADVLAVFPGQPTVLAIASPYSLEVASTSATVLLRPDGLAATAARIQLFAKLRRQL